VPFGLEQGYTTNLPIEVLDDDDFLVDDLGDHQYNRLVSSRNRGRPVPEVATPRHSSASSAAEEEEDFPP